MLSQEQIGYVRQAIQNALAFHESEFIGLRLLDRMTKAENQEQWSICEIFFELLPPEILGLENDLPWIGPAFDHLQPMLQDHVNERYQKALKKVDER